MKITHLMLVLTTVLLQPAQAALTLEQSIKKAQNNDWWQIENNHQRQVVTAKTEEAMTLPNPKLSFSTANFPTDTFEFGQEPMTQLKVGLSQSLPRGDTRHIRQQIFQSKNLELGYQQQDRKAMVRLQVTNLWLELSQAQVSIELIEQKRYLFEQLVEAAQSRYTSAFGKTQQQDIISSRLELVKLDDKLQVLKLKKDRALSQLSQWLMSPDKDVRFTDIDISELEIGETISEIQPDYAENLSDETLFEQLLKHPAIMSLNQKIEGKELDIEMSRQQFKPAYSLNASYGYRGTSLQGMDRADFLSLGVVMDFPLFSKSAANARLRASVAQAEAADSHKWLIINKMKASVADSRTRLNNLKKRLTIYQDEILPQLKDKSRVMDRAYANKEVDFDRVSTSKIEELNALLTEIEIKVEINKTINQLNYLFCTIESETEKSDVE